MHVWTLDFQTWNNVASPSTLLILGWPAQRADLDMLMGSFSLPIFLPFYGCFAKIRTGFPNHIEECTMFHGLIASQPVQCDSFKRSVTVIGQVLSSSFLKYLNHLCYELLKDAVTGNCFICKT